MPPWWPAPSQASKCRRASSGATSAMPAALNPSASASALMRWFAAATSPTGLLVGARGGAVRATRTRPPWVARGLQGFLEPRPDRAHQVQALGGPASPLDHRSRLARHLLGRAPCFIHVHSRHRSRRTVRGLLPPLGAHGKNDVFDPDSRQSVPERALEARDRWPELDPRAARHGGVGHRLELGRRHAQVRLWLESRAEVGGAHLVHGRKAKRAARHAHPRSFTGSERRPADVLVAHLPRHPRGTPVDPGAPHPALEFVVEPTAVVIRRPTERLGGDPYPAVGIRRDPKAVLV